MLLVISASSYSSSCVHFSSAVKNNIIENSLFTRLFYSTEIFTTNGLFLKHFTPADVHKIELDLLTLYNSGKEKVYMTGELSNYSMLKISGIWENGTKIGLAYKLTHLF